MDPEESVANLLSKNEQLVQENHQLKAMLSVVKENQDPRAQMQSFNNDTLQELSGRKPPSLFQNTCNETQFRKDLERTKFSQQRTSSPIDMKSFIQSSVYTDTSESYEADIPLEVKGSHRLLGEITYQLDRRILSHVFQGHRRLYGFTLLNIPDKIIEVSTHPLTGKVDEGYRLHLTQRYTVLMERLNQLGYKTKLHPPFTEFIVNTYGILRERPGENSTQTMDYNNPDFLIKLIKTKAPRTLHKDLLLLLTCLCHMAEEDGNPLFLW